MNVVRESSQLRAVLEKARSRGKSIGFVPTMGGLHAGHVSLIRRARKENDILVVSIFVNPTQFGPGEDFKRYPRPFQKDRSVCAQERVDYVFYPRVKGMYPSGFSTYVTVEGLSQGLCGRSRPGHFRGVATVVTKLFNIVLPHRAYFGQKDAQQALIIQRMVRDLDMPVQVKVLPIVREKDGLAFSSRNRYLSASERLEARVLYRALRAARALLQSGERNSQRIIPCMKKIIQSARRARVEYISFVDARSLVPVKEVRGFCLIALAVWIGRRRLIDNIIVHA